MGTKPPVATSYGATGALAATSLAVAAVLFSCTPDVAESQRADLPSTLAATTGGERPTASAAFAAAPEKTPPPSQPRPPSDATPPEDAETGPPPDFVRVPIEDSSGHALAAFHAALRRAELGQGQARIVFYGASHVASDMFTDVVRRRLQDRFGNGGPGFVLPAKPWRWYRHAGITVERSRGFDDTRVKARAPRDGLYGLAGVALDAEKRYAIGAIETRDGGKPSGASQRVELYYLKQPHGGRLTLFVDGERTRRLRTDAAEPAAAYELLELDGDAHRFEVRTHGDGPVRIFGVALEHDRPGVVLDTLGIPGARARYHLHWDDALYREHLARRRPDLVVLAYGTNESGDDDVPIEAYEARLRKVLARIRDVTPDASCLLVGPSDRPIRHDDDSFESRPRTAQIVGTQRRVAADVGCGFFDVVAFMGGDMSMVRWVQMEDPLGTPDHVHYTRRGYEALGEVLHDALLAGYQSASPAEAVSEARVSASADTPRTP